MKLGSLLLRNKFILSPLEAVSDNGFRKLCYSLGASLTWTEMVRAGPIVKNQLSNLDLIDTYDEDTKAGVQLLVKSHEELQNCLLKLEHLAFNVEKYKHLKNIVAVDLNFGCPSTDIIGEGCGPALLKRRSKVTKIFAALSEWKAVTKLPKLAAVGCKIRLGLNLKEKSEKVMTHQPTHQPIYPPTHLPTNLSTHLSIYPPT